MKIWISFLLIVIPIKAIAELERCSQEPVLIESVSPEYPMPNGTTADLHTCHKGTVDLKFIILADGSVSSPKVIHSSLVKGCRNHSAGEDFFYQTSKDAVSQFRYSAQPASCWWFYKFTYETK